MPNLNHDVVEELEAEIERLREHYDKHLDDRAAWQAEIERLRAVVDAAKEYEKMFARSRTKPYSVSNELQALFDALSTQEDSDGS